MINVKTEVKAVLLLDFELPGVTWTGRGGSGQQSQLEQRFGETWQMRVTPENALATAETLNKLAAAIVEAFKGSYRS
jgi:hypothetical protein